MSIVRNPVYKFGAYLLDSAEKSLVRNGKGVSLTPKAFDTLQALIENHGRVVSHEELLHKVWPDSFVEENNLAQNISLLRKCLQQTGEAEYIQTIPKRGYRFVAPVTVCEMQAGATASLSETETRSTARSATQPETHYARSGDVNIAYQVLGNGPIDLVFVMGWVSHLEYFWAEPSFARFLRRLASFSRLILFDKRGTGLSDRVPLHALPTLEQRMDDLRAVLEAVGSHHAVICSVSEGGPMSALYAATYPEKTLALIMIGTYAKRIRDTDYLWGQSNEEHRSFLREIETEWGGPVGIKERAPSMAQDQQFREWWAAYLRMGASPGAAVALTKMNSQIDVRAVLPSVRVPALVLHRKDDHCLKVEEGRFVASLIPNATFVELDGADHLPFVGDQDAIVDEIRQFLIAVQHDPDLERVLATVLFTRQSGSSHLAAEHQLKKWRGQSSKEVERHGGRSIERGGTLSFAVFDGPARAIRCACSLVEDGARSGLLIGAGLHTGECDRLEADAIGGLAVDIATQIVSQAAPGEVLVSRTVRDLVAGSGFRFENRGTLPLRLDLGEWPIFRVHQSIQQIAAAATREP